jgi:DNA-directed RNA polymerase specialized sigma24 family protein
LGETDDKHYCLTKIHKEKKDVLKLFLHEVKSMNLQSSAILDNEEIFNDLRQQVLMRAQTCIKHQQIVLHITDAIMLSLWENPDDEADMDSWIKKQVDRQTESYIEDLWQYTFAYALSLLKNPDNAQDIAQSTMMAFLSNHKRIDFVKAWLKRTAFNLAMRTFHEAAAENRLQKKLAINHSPFSDPHESQATKKRINNSDIKRHLTAAEHKEWQRLNRIPNLRDYASKENLNYSQLKKRKHILKKKISSGLHRDQGWEDGPEILNYHTLTNIKRFMQTLVEYATKTGQKRICRYCPKELINPLHETLGDMKQIDDWGIFIDSVGYYNISILDSSEPQKPKLSMIKIRINRANQIQISECYTPQLLGTSLADRVEPLPLDKGKCMLSMADIYKIIT